MSSMSSTIQHMSCVFGNLQAIIVLNPPSKYAKCGDMLDSHRDDRRNDRTAFQCHHITGILCRGETLIIDGASIHDAGLDGLEAFFGTLETRMREKKEVERCTMKI